MSPVEVRFTEIPCARSSLALPCSSLRRLEPRHSLRMIDGRPRQRMRTLIVFRHHLIASGHYRPILTTTGRRFHHIIADRLRRMTTMMDRPRRHLRGDTDGHL